MHRPCPRKVRDRVNKLLDIWSKIADDYHNQGTTLQYNQREAGAAKPLLHEFLDPELKLMSSTTQVFSSQSVHARR